MLASVSCLQGQLDPVREEFETWGADGFQVVPRDLVRISNLCLLAEICAALGHEELAGTLYDELEPYRERVVVIRVVALVQGSVARSLGLLAAVQESEWQIFQINLLFPKSTMHRPSSSVWHVRHTSPQRNLASPNIFQPHITGKN